MKKTPLLRILLLLVILLQGCDHTTEMTNTTMEVHLIPHPKEIISSGRSLLLSEKSRTYTPNEELKPLLELFNEEMQQLHGINVPGDLQKTGASDIVFEIDPTLGEEEYVLEIDNTILAKGGSYQALAWAKTTLLQLSEKEQNTLAFPVLRIRDAPDVQYRGLMIDLARQWHSIPAIKKIIDLAAYYKTRYLHLHFTDYQSYTLPSRLFPKLPTPGRSYSFEDLGGLESYSQLRGVTIVPEIDIPGHSSPFVKMYPEIFAISNTEENPWIVNMGKEEVYQSLDGIIGEVLEVFKATPYFHIGGDEAIFDHVMEDPEVQAYVKEHGLGEDVHELYRHFLVRLNEIVKKHNRRMCVWEGFRREGGIEIPKEILVFEFETNRYLPNHLAEDGYQVVNTSWKPLYVVNQKKWEPRTIYQWNIWRWHNWWPNAPSYTPIQLPETEQVIGAEMCAWEQAEAHEIPSLRKRLPAMNERIWNRHEKVSYDPFMSSLETTDEKLSVLIADHRQDSLLIDYNFAKPPPREDE